MKKSKTIILLLILILATTVFTRFYNLENTARFIWDESSDLVKMHQYYVENRLTLIGPVTEDGTRVYSSLTYYLLMPFAIIGDFDPLSPVIGTAFWGTSTALMLIYLGFKTNRKLTVPTIILAICWYPLVETSRWAWNPNLLPFWTTLGLIFYLKAGPINRLICGILLGLSIHHHYLAIFALGGFVLAQIVQTIKSRKIIELAGLISGILLSISPFIIFDLFHPPGLFLTRVLFFNNTQLSMDIIALFQKDLVWYQYMLNYYLPIPQLATIFGIAMLVLLIFDIIKKRLSLTFAAPWVAQLLGLAFIHNPGPIYYYYHLPATIFFLIWLISPRQGYHRLLATFLVFLLTLGSLLSIYPQLNKSSWQTDIPAIRSISQAIGQNISKNQLKNVNLAVLASPDNNTYGRRYRDLLLIKNIEIIDRQKYSLADHLFVISTSSAELVRLDLAPEIVNFRKGPIIEQWKINNSPWFVYHLTKH